MTMRTRDNKPSTYQRCYLMFLLAGNWAHKLNNMTSEEVSKQIDRQDKLRREYGIRKVNLNGDEGEMALETMKRVIMFLKDSLK